MKNQMGNSRMDTVLKMLLIAFISLLAFSSGVYFGKQMTDSDYQVKALESDFNSHSKSAKHETHESNDATPEDAIADEEVAALSDKFVNAQKDELAEHASEEAETRKVASADQHDEHEADAEEGHGHAAAPAPKAVANAHGAQKSTHGAAESNAKPDLSAAHKAAVRVANNASPVETPKAQPESRVPSSLPKTVGISSEVEFTVQVASYPTAAAAKDHADELVKKGFPAFPVEATIKGRTWYRVSVGSFKTMKDATSYRTTLLKRAEVPSAIVQRIQR